MPAPGQRAKLINTLDRQMADDLQPLYSIEVSVAKSPQKKVKCGAIVIFKLNSVNLNLDKAFNTKTHNPMVIERAQEIQDEISKQTEVMWQDPIYFKEPDGQWLPWALDKALKLFDKAPISGNANITLKCPQLRISALRTRKEITLLRSNPRQLFPVIRDIDELLGRDFKYDPWSKKIRRGRISAEMSKR